MNTQAHDPKYWAIVPAAGLGSRMGTAIPKQYLRLGKKTILEHSVQKLLNHPVIKKVVVVLHAKDRFWPACDLQHTEKLLTAIGGGERADSVMNGLAVLHDLAAGDDWVLVHDAARPCLHPKDLERLITKLAQHPVGGLLGVPVKDTLKRINAKGCVIQTVDRTAMWCAQTPQMFRFNLLQTALINAAKQSPKVTDEAAAIEKLGHQPQIVPGDPRNIKITQPIDLQLAKIMIQQTSL